MQLFKQQKKKRIRKEEMSSLNLEG